MVNQANDLVVQREQGALVSKVPFFGLDRQYARYRETFLSIADRVLSTGQVLQGESVQALESALCAVTNRKHAVAVGSCTDGLAFALAALEIGAGDEVLVTSFSFLASASPILRVGARPRFVDIDPQTFMMNLDDLERFIGPATKAIVAVHMYGQSLPMDRLEAIANRHGIALIEDAAQGLGTQYRGRPVGSMGRVSCLSFDPTKVIGSFSSGGGVVTDDPEIARRIAMQRYHGRDPATREYELLGFNSQLPTEMAAMLLFKLSKMREWEAERHAVANIYQTGLADLTQQITLPARVDGSSHNWHKFVLRAADRDGLMAHLKNKGIQTLVHYPTAICDTPLFAHYSGESDVPEARHAVRTVLSLPIFAELNAVEAQTVVQRIREYYHQ